MGVFYSRSAIKLRAFNISPIKLGAGLMITIGEDHGVAGVITILKVSLHLIFYLVI